MLVSTFFKQNVNSTCFISLMYEGQYNIWSEVSSQYTTSSNKHQVIFFPTQLYKIAFINICPCKNSFIN